MKTSSVSGKNWIIKKYNHETANYLKDNFNLSEIISRLLSIRVLFFIALSGFLIACLGCGLTNNFYLLVTFRIMQGFFGGALMPLMFSCIYILFTPLNIKKVNSLFPRDNIHNTSSHIVSSIVWFFNLFIYFIRYTIF